MTIRERLIAKAVDHGLWQHEAAAVVDGMAAADVDGLMAGRWDDDAEGVSCS